MSENVTINKSTFKLLLAGFVAVLLVASFLAGYFVGTARTTGNAAAAGGAQVQNAPAAPAPQPPPAVQVTADDDPIKGDANAPVTIIEFSDFQCPFCSRFYIESLPQIEENYIKTGKVKLVYRDFPLTQIHPNAFPAALAAECANEQGKFWEYHDKLFSNQGSLGTDTYKQWAGEMGMDTAKFNSCLDSGKYTEEVQKDLQDGINSDVSGTPTFFIGNDNKGYLKIVGAQPYSNIKQAIDQALAAA